MRKKQRLTPDDWIRAGVRALSAGGPAEIQATANVFRAIVVDDVFIGEGAGFKVELTAS